MNFKFTVNQMALAITIVDKKDLGHAPHKNHIDKVDP